MICDSQCHVCKRDHCIREEHEKAWRKKYYETHKAERLAYQKKYNDEHRAERSEYQRMRRSNNK